MIMAVSVTIGKKMHLFIDPRKKNRSNRRIHASGKHEGYCAFIHQGKILS